MDGVLIGDRASPYLSGKIIEKVHELFEKKEGLNGGFTELEWRIAASYFLSKDAVSNLENLIEKTNEVYRIVIVIISEWRLDGTALELKNLMFAVTSFGKLIIDKIPDHDFWRRRHKEVELSPISLQKYGFPLEQRGQLIDFWLRENAHNYNIKSFVILDDVDEGISKRFPHHFVHVHNMLSEYEAKRAHIILTKPSPSLCLH